MRSLESVTNLRNTITITILVVKLSNKAERKKVMNATRHNNLRLLEVSNLLRTKLKPPLASMISTIVIAAIKKKSISQASLRW